MYYFFFNMYKSYFLRRVIRLSLPTVVCEVEEIIEESGRSAEWPKMGLWHSMGKALK